MESQLRALLGGSNRKTKVVMAVKQWFQHPMKLGVWKYHKKIVPSEWFHQSFTGTTLEAEYIGQQSVL